MSRNVIISEIQSLNCKALLKVTVNKDEKMKQLDVKLTRKFVQYFVKTYRVSDMHNERIY